MSNENNEKEDNGAFWLIGFVIVIPLYLYLEYSGKGFGTFVEHMFYSALVILFFKYVLGAK